MAEEERCDDKEAGGAQVVAFVKGTRSAPECGFSHQVLTLLNASRADYEVSLFVAMCSRVIRH